MPKDLLLEAIRARGRKSEPFGRGILTADHYVSTLADMIGPDACNQIARKGRGSFDDLLKAAERTLTYSNDDMILEEKRVNGELGGAELPKNCLMTFRHVLTSSTKDRDGDTLHSDGADVDPKMLLLWQHVHTLPIGKCIKVLDQNADRLQVVSCIVDMNQLCHDAAVMVDNDMGRFSHGFRALEFTETKARDGHPGGGFDVTKFEIMEESLVSVPANVDAQTEEVLLSLVEGGKLKSPLMKQVGRCIREHRGVQVPGVRIRYRERLGDYSKELTCASLADLKTAVDAGLIGGKDHENEPGDRGEKGAGTENSAGASEETDVKAANKVPAEDTDDAKVTCPECDWEGPMPEDSECPKCGAELASVEEGMLDEEKAVDWIDAKPFPNEHAARIMDPEKYEKFRRQNNKFGEGVHAVFGVTADGKAELQAIRFDRSKFTAEEARKWLADNKYKPMMFEPSSEKEFTGTKALTHNSTLKDSEPSWASVDKTKLPRGAFADQGDPDKKSTWGYPHHWVEGGSVDENGVYKDGTMHLSRGGLIAAWAAANGARSGQGAGAAVRAHLQVHRKALGLGEEKELDMTGGKAGRVLNSANEKRIKEAMGCHDEILKLGEGHTSPPARALVKEAHTHLDAVCKSLGDPTTGTPRDMTANAGEVDAKTAMAAFLTKATADQRKHMADVLAAIEKAERVDPRTKQYQALMGHASS